MAGEWKVWGVYPIGGEYFVWISALNVDPTDMVVPGSCNCEHGTN